MSGMLDHRKQNKNRKRGLPLALTCGNPLTGRDGGIRTHDPLTPSQVRYQAALRPGHPVGCADSLPHGSGDDHDPLAVCVSAGHRRYVRGRAVNAACGSGELFGVSCGQLRAVDELAGREADLALRRVVEVGSGADRLERSSGALDLDPHVVDPLVRVSAASASTSASVMRRGTCQTQPSELSLATVRTSRPGGGAAQLRVVPGAFDRRDVAGDDRHRSQPYHRERICAHVRRRNPDQVIPVLAPVFSWRVPPRKFPVEMR